MAKVNLEKEIAAMLEDEKSFISAVEDNQFRNSNGEELKVRTMDNDYDRLEVGDIIEIPNNFKVFERPFGRDANASSPKYPFALCKLIKKDGSEQRFQFFPNSLCKTITPIKDGKRQPRIKTTGTATEAYAKFATVNEALDSLKGKKILIADETVYTIIRYGATTPTQTSIFKYDLVK